MLYALIAKAFIDAGAVASFWRDKPMALMFFGFLVCDIAAVWIRAIARS